MCRASRRCQPTGSSSADARAGRHVGRLTPATGGARDADRPGSETRWRHLRTQPTTRLGGASQRGPSTGSSSADARAGRHAGRLNTGDGGDSHVQALLILGQEKCLVVDTQGVQLPTRRALPAMPQASSIRAEGPRLLGYSRKRPDPGEPNRWPPGTSDKVRNWHTARTRRDRRCRGRGRRGGSP